MVQQSYSKNSLTHLNSCSSYFQKYGPYIYILILYFVVSYGACLMRDEFSQHINYTMDKKYTYKSVWYKQIIFIVKYVSIMASWLFNWNYKYWLWPYFRMPHWICVITSISIFVYDFWLPIVWTRVCYICRWFISVLWIWLRSSHLW